MAVMKNPKINQHTGLLIWKYYYHWKIQCPRAKQCRDAVVEFSVETSMRSDKRGVYLKPLILLDARDPLRNRTAVETTNLFCGLGGTRRETGASCGCTNSGINTLLTSTSAESVSSVGTAANWWRRRKVKG